MDAAPSRVRAERTTATAIATARLGNTTGTAASATGIARIATAPIPPFSISDSRPVVQISGPSSTDSHDAVAEIGANVSTALVANTDRRVKRLQRRADPAIQTGPYRPGQRSLGVSPTAQRYYLVILRDVKVAVSIPDAVFQAAEDLAARRQCSRSSLYAQALERLLAEADGDDVTTRLDAVYAEEPSELDPTLRDAQDRALAEPW